MKVTLWLKMALKTISHSPLQLLHSALLQRSPKNPKKKKKEHVESDSKFMVESEKTKDTFYTCDMLSGLDIVLVPWDQPVHFKIALFSVAPVSDPKMRAMYHFNSLGKVLPAN